MLRPNCWPRLRSQARPGELVGFITRAGELSPEDAVASFGGYHDFLSSLSLGSARDDSVWASFSCNEF